MPFYTWRHNYLRIIFYDLVKILKRRISVIPANPGSGPGQAPESSYFKYLKILWTPVSTGVTTFYENIMIIIILIKGSCQLLDRPLHGCS